MLFPTQKIESKDKTELWAKKCTDYIISEGNRELRADISRMMSNYRMINSQMDEEEFRSVCRSLGVNEKTGRKYISMYNKTPNMLFTLKGEELDRPFNWTVTSITDQPNNRDTREEELKFIKYTEDVFTKEFQKLNELIQQEIKLKSQGLSEQEVKNKMQEIQQQVENKYKSVYDLNKIQSNHKNIKTTKELAITNLMKIAMNRLDFKWIKNECFEDAAKTGKEYVEITFEEGNVLPIIRQLNVINSWCHKSPNSPFVHDSDYAGYKEEFTLGQVLDQYADELTEKDIKKLQTHAYSGSSPYGTTDKMYHNKGDRHASSWYAKKDAGMYPSGSMLDKDAEMILDGKYAAVPTSSYTSSNNIYGPGLYADAKSHTGRYIAVYTCYWKSYRKAYKYSYFDDYNEMVEEFVDESFVIPDNHKKEKYRNTKFGKVKTKMIWYDDEGKYNCVEEIWIPEIWKAKRLNGDVYVEMGPLEHAYQSLTNPYKTKIPIFGYVYNARNSNILCFADRIAPWQKLYYSVMARLIKNLSQDKGILTFFNSLMVNDEIGLKETLAFAEDGKIVPYNPLEYAKSSNMMSNTMKVAERVDATNSSVVEYYISLLKFIEGQMNEAVGMSQQRLAKSSQYSTATDNQRDTMHSMNMTEPMFYAHDLLWEKICQGYMEMLISSVNESTNKIRGLLDDHQIAVIDLNLISLEDEYLFKVSNNIRNNKILEILKANVHAFIQNDKFKFSTLLSMLKIDDLNEFEKEIKEFEDRMEEQQKQAEESQKAHEENLKRMEMENREDQQIADLNKQYLSESMRTKRDIEKEHIKGKYMVTSYNLQKDSDADGISDLMENEIKYKEFLNSIAEKEEQINREREKLEMQKAELKHRIEKDKKELELKKKQINNKSKTTK